MFDLTGKKALITGASGGIGVSIAKALHAQGATVGLHGTREERLKEIAAELGDRVHIFPANLGDAEEVKALAQKAEADMEGIDILVNNAGITKDGLFVRMSDDDWDAVMDINLKATFPTDSRCCVPDDAPQGRPYYQYHVNCRRDRKSGAGQLLRLEGRYDWHVKISCDGNRQPQGHSQLCCTRIYRDADDGRTQ